MPPLPAFLPAAGDEFPAGASAWAEDISRRRFLELMGASFALAGLSGCGAQPKGQFAPYAVPPGTEAGGDPVYFATAMPVEGYARGILVKSHFGRPTKIEGNPGHPESRGATDGVTQAAILGLYDPDRSRAPRRSGQPAAWPEFEKEWLERRRALAPGGGAGLAILTEPTTSPTQRREIHRLLDAFPRARWFQHSALARRDRDGSQPDYDFEAADVVFSIGGDFLHDHPAALRYSRAFAGRRRLENGQMRLNRFYALEGTPTVTGSMADHRLPVSPGRLPALLQALAQAWDGASGAAHLSEPEKAFVSALARDWRTQAPRVLCVAGPQEDEDVHAWAAAANARFGATRTTLRSLPAIRSDGDPRAAGALGELAAAIGRDEVRALVVLGANPAYAGPADLAFADALGRVPWTVHLGLQADETAARCRWHLPESHFLESWGDLRGYEGTATILQPLIEPLYASRSIPELLRFLSEAQGRDGYDLVRETWQEGWAGGDFEENWTRWLNDGVMMMQPALVHVARASGQGGLSRRSAAKTDGLASTPESPPSLTLLFRPDPNLSDGRWANNAWLQELPQPMTHLVWDNAALVSPALAARLGLENGDIVSLGAGGRELEAPIWIMPGQAESCITLPLGRGRTHAGTVGNGSGFNAYQLRTSHQPWRTDQASIRKTGTKQLLVSTQRHFAMEGRDLVRIEREGAGSLGVKSDLTPSDPAPSSLYPETPRAGYAWGMSIDLSTCLGCNACVIACQAENNIPVVGKEQAARGREMHWIRVDRYYEGDPANPRLLHQPVPCMHCENAPCELVCPVGATVHSSEGLNEMVYNRCIGTRYCSNNCPYKVRRFNFLDFREARGSPLYLQKNPDVTVRARGVMEKCTYCVQRIDQARIAAEKENRLIRDGELQTACQQACPAQAIVFGDISDPASRVSRRKREKTDYALLAELNTRPRTTYLARMMAPVA